MSHIVSIKSEVHDPVAVAAACDRLHLAKPVHGTATLFSGEAKGLVLQLPDWQYPAVIDTTSGIVTYDNYEGKWGAQQELDRFLQMYAVEKTKIEAKKRGYMVSEHALQDGAIKVQIVEAG